MKETNSPDAGEPPTTGAVFTPEQLAVVASIAKQTAREELLSFFSPPPDQGAPAKEDRALRRPRPPK